MDRKKRKHQVREHRYYLTTGERQRKYSTEKLRTVLDSRVSPDQEKAIYIPSVIYIQNRIAIEYQVGRRVLELADLYEDLVRLTPNLKSLARRKNVKSLAQGKLGKLIDAYNGTMTKSRAVAEEIVGMRGSLHESQKDYNERHKKFGEITRSVEIVFREGITKPGVEELLNELESGLLKSSCRPISSIVNLGKKLQRGDPLSPGEQSYLLALNLGWRIEDDHEFMRQRRKEFLQENMRKISDKRLKKDERIASEMLKDIEWYELTFGKKEHFADIDLEIIRARVTIRCKEKGQNANRYIQILEALL